MRNALESIPFEFPHPADPKRVIRGVLDQPAGTRAAGVQRPAVFLMHGFKGFFRWGFFPEAARQIARAGLVSVRFNFSGSGVGSDLENFTDDAGFEANTVARERDDAIQVIETVCGPEFPWVSRDAIGILGHSMGAGIALLLAAGASPRRVASLVTWGAVASFDRFSDEQKQLLKSQGWLPIPNARTGQVHRVGREWFDELERLGTVLDPLEASRHVKAPTLILHGSADASVGIDEGERLFAAFGPAIAQFRILEGAGHTFGATHPLCPESPTEVDAVASRETTDRPTQAEELLPPDLVRALDLSLGHLTQCLSPSPRGEG